MKNLYDSLWSIIKTSSIFLISFKFPGALGLIERGHEVSFFFFFDVFTTSPTVRFNSSAAFLFVLHLFLMFTSFSSPRYSPLLPLLLPPSWYMQEFTVKNSPASAGSGSFQKEHMQSKLRKVITCLISTSTNSFCSQFSTHRKQWKDHKRQWMRKSGKWHGRDYFSLVLYA